MWQVDGLHPTHRMMRDGWGHSGRWLLVVGKQTATEATANTGFFAPLRMTKFGGERVEVRVQQGGQVGLLLEQREDEGEDVFCDYLVALGGGVSVVGLHHAIDAVDVL
jgi:hypothetical protein